MRVRTEVKREAILQVAAEVFQELGFDGASMTAIASRVGGSKSTLYGYFTSKEELFLEVSHEAAKRHIEPTIEALLASRDEDLGTVLCQFGNALLTTVSGDASIKTLRTIIGQAGRSDIGKRFYDTGPKVGMQQLAVFFQKQIDVGRMRQTDALVAAQHLFGLFDAEVIRPMLMGAIELPSAKELGQAVERAVDGFLYGYGRGRVQSVGGVPQAKPEGRAPEHALADIKDVQ